MAVRALKYEPLSVGVHYVEYAGLADDDKPVGGGIATGSKFFEIDTGKTFYYDEEGAEGSEWIDPTAT